MPNPTQTITLQIDGRLYEAVLTPISPLPVWPSKGDTIFRITSQGEIVCYPYFSGKNSAEAITKNRADFLGIFKTREEAEAKLAKVKALCGSNKWKPKEFEDIWLGTYSNEFPTKTVFAKTGYMNFLLSIGAIHRTESDARAWHAAVTKI